MYELIARSFIGSLSKDAKGHESKVVISLGVERFNLTALKVTEKNYLDVFTYEKWLDSAIIDADFFEGQTFTDFEIFIAKSFTTSPLY